MCLVPRARDARFNTVMILLYYRHSVRMCLVPRARDVRFCSVMSLLYLSTFGTRYGCVFSLVLVMFDFALLRAYFTIGTRYGCVLSLVLVMSDFALL